MAFFDQITLEGLVFLEKGVVSGFNIENDEFLNAISLNVKYYHSTPEHIQFLTTRLCEEFRRRFGKEPEIMKHDKVGVFRWEPYFDLEAEYKYFAVIGNGAYTVTEIPSETLSSYTGSGFLIASSQDRIINFIIRSGPEGEFVYKYLRRHAQKRILVNGRLVDNPNVIDGKCHQIPLFIVKDTEGLIQDKSGLVEVVNLKFLKGDRCLQSLVKPLEVGKIFERLGGFDCDFELRREARYVSLEFASYM